MTIQITRTGKYSVLVDTPVMNAAGTLGFANIHYSQIAPQTLGAFVTNPVTLGPRSPARGARVVPMDAGVLLHTGLPNAGLSKVVKEFQHVWYESPIPVIMHLVARDPDEMQRMVRRLDAEESVMALEIGLRDDTTWEEAEVLVGAAAESEKPILVRIPVYDAYELAHAVVDAGADALVVAAPPRGTARDPLSGQLITGRIYGPMVKPMVLRLVEVLAGRIQDIPIIGGGGIHSLQDARDYLEAGAIAVQIDSLIWSQPAMVEAITRRLGNLPHPNAANAPSEMSDADFADLFSDDTNNA